MFKYVLLVCTLFAGLAYSQTQLNGLSAYSQLNKEYYIGALYTERTMSVPAEIFADNSAQKMLLRVTANRWSPRKFTEIWKQDLSINNDLSRDLQLTEQILAFTNLTQDNLTVGDELEINYTPAAGTVVQLNGEPVMRSTGKALFNAVLSTWIGEVPPSRLFQSDILGQEAIVTSQQAQLTTRFEQMRTAPERKQLVSLWRAAEARAAAELAAAEAALKAQQEREASARAQAQAEQKRRDDERRKAEQLAEQKKREAEAAQARQQSNNGNPTSEQEAAAAKKALEEALAAQQAAEAEAARLAARSAQEAQAELATQYALDSYQWQVMADVYQRVSYPEWARQFEQEGVVRIEFIVSRSGQLVGITSVTPADAGLLGQELKDAVAGAAPFDRFPAEIKDSQLKLAISYEFRIDERVAELPPKPDAPAGLATAELSSSQKAVRWSQYQQQIRDDIEAAIEYPFWAQDLKQEGEVVAEVTIRRDGSVSDVSLTQKTRHSILNQEVEQAVARAANFAAFPAWITQEQITLTIRHQFKL